MKSPSSVEPEKEKKNKKMSKSFKVKGLRSRQAQAISLRFYVAAFYKGIYKSASAPAVGVYVLQFTPIHKRM